MQARPWRLSDEPSGPTWLELFRDEPEVEGGAKSVQMCGPFWCTLSLCPRSFAFLEALVLLGLPLLKFTQLALLFGFGLLAPLIFVAPCTLPCMCFVLGLAPVDC